MINEGIYLDLTSEQYHGDKSSISRTALMDFKKNPRRYWAKHLNPNRPPSESKPSWEFGTAFHTLILEPHLFAEQYYVMPEKVLLKNVGRELYDQFKRVEKEGIESNLKPIAWEHWVSLANMRDSLMANPKARDLIEGAIYESSYFWRDKSSGLMVKSRPDILNGNIYVDLKTIDDASPSNFQREMAKYGYHIQAAMCREGVRILESRELSACINICVEKNYPYGIGIYIIDEEAVNAGHREYKQALLDMRACISDNTFQDYEPQIISLPTWATK